MNVNPTFILIVIAITLAVVAMIRPAWPLCPVAVLLLAVAILLR